MPTRRRPQHRSVLFDVVDDHLEMKVSFSDQPDAGYVHRCTDEVFREVAHAIEERASKGVTLDDLAEALDAPFTQVNVALSFLKERGCVEVRRRRSYPASTALYEDAMTEYTFLAGAPY